MAFTGRSITGSLLALALLGAPAAAQYPNKPITVIVPFAAGGPTDVVTRLVGDHMSRALGNASASKLQNVVKTEIRRPLAGIVFLPCRRPER